MESSMEGLGIALRHEFTFSVAFSQKCDSVYEKTTALSHCHYFQLSCMPCTLLPGVSPWPPEPEMT